MKQRCLQRLNRLITIRRYIDRQYFLNDRLTQFKDLANFLNALFLRGLPIEMRGRRMVNLPKLVVFPINSYLQFGQLHIFPVLSALLADHSVKAAHQMVLLLVKNSRVMEQLRRHVPAKLMFTPQTNRALHFFIKKSDVFFAIHAISSFTKSAQAPYFLVLASFA